MFFFKQQLLRSCFLFLWRWRAWERHYRPEPVEFGKLDGKVLGRGRLLAGLLRGKNKTRKVQKDLLRVQAPKLRCNI